MPKPNPAATTTAVDLIDIIDNEADQAIALLQMLRVFCNLEERDVTVGEIQPDQSLSDAAPGLAVLLSDIADRIESIKDKARKACRVE